MSDDALTQYPLSVFIFQPAFSSVNDMLPMLKKNRPEPVETAESFAPIEERIQVGQPCVLVLSISRDTDLKQILTFLRGIRSFTSRGTVRVVVVSQVTNEKLKSGLLTLGVSEILNDKASASTVYFKTSLLLTQIQRSVNKDGDKEKDVNRIQSSQRSGSRTENINVKGTAQNQHSVVEAISEDVWLIKGVAPKKIGVQWMIEAEGPDPDSGDWEFLGTVDGRQEKWAWRPKDKDGNKVPIQTDDEAWAFTGNKPTFEAGAKKWRMVGTKPDLSLEEDGKKKASKVQTDPEKGVLIAADSPDAEARIEESKKIGAAVKERRENEVAAEVAKRKEEEERKRVRSAENAAESEAESLASAQAKADGEKTREGSKLSFSKSESAKALERTSATEDKRESLEAAAATGADSKPVGEVNEPRRQNALANAGKEVLPDTMNSANSVAPIEAIKKNSPGSMPDMDVPESAKLETHSHSKAQARSPSAKAGPSSMPEDKLDAKFPTKADSKTGDKKTELKPGTNPSAKELKPGAAGIAPDAKAQSAATLSKKPSQVEPAAKNARAKDPSLQSTSRAPTSSTASSKGTKASLSSQAPTAIPRAGSEVAQDSGALQKQNKNPSNSKDKPQTGVKSPEIEKGGRSKSAPIGESESGGKNTKPAKPGVLSADPKTSGDWQEQKKKGLGVRMGEVDRAEDEMQRNYMFKRTNGILRTNKSEKPLERVAASEFGSDQGTWEEVGDRGWIFMTPEMKSQGLDLIMAKNGFNYLERGPGIEKPFYDGKSKSWLFSDGNIAKRTETFSGLPKEYKDHLGEIGRSPMDVLSAVQESKDILDAEAAITEKTFDSFTDSAVETSPQSKEFALTQSSPSKSSASAGKSKKQSYLGFFLKLSDMAAKKKPDEEIYAFVIKYVQDLSGAENVFLLKPVFLSPSSAFVLASTNSQLQAGREFDLTKTLFKDAFSYEELHIKALSEVKTVAVFPLVQPVIQKCVGAFVIQFASVNAEKFEQSQHFLDQLSKQLLRMLTAVSLPASKRAI